jgi:hypothetical protein
MFQADPHVIKFEGYETGRTHTLKFNLINKSSIPQRVHILPTMT